MLSDDQVSQMLQDIAVIKEQVSGAEGLPSMRSDIKWLKGKMFMALGGLSIIGTAVGFRILVLLGGLKP